jgi:hypothetical protein
VPLLFKPSDRHNCACLLVPRLRRLPKDRQLGPELLYRTCQCDRDRTYGSAVALKNWIDQHQVNVTGFNIITENVHARRSRPLFQWAFGNRVRLGVIAVQNPRLRSSPLVALQPRVERCCERRVRLLVRQVLFSPHEEKPVKGERLAGHD